MGRGELELHELEVPSVALLPFAVGSCQGIESLSLADFPHRHTFYEIVRVRVLRTRRGAPCWPPPAHRAPR